MKQEKKLFKHQTAITVIAVIITVTVAIGSSYLLFNRQDNNKEYNAFKEEDFEEVGKIIAYRLKNEETDQIKEECIKRVKALTDKVEMYNDIKYI